MLELGPRSSRHLVTRSSTLSPIRLTYYYYNFSLNNQTLEDQFKGTLIKLVDSFFSTSLKVYPIEGNLKLSASSCLTAVKVPTEHKTVGVSDTDVLIYITSNQLTNVSYVAYAGACETDQYGLGNVMAGTVVINVPNFSDNSMEEWLANMAHEMSHLLGFSSRLFDSWRNSTGELYPKDQVKRKVTVRGVEKSILVTPNILKYARKAFNCSTLEGVELEEAGGSGTAGSHWDKRIMMNDYMVSSIPSDGIFSDISLALFKDTGWYDVNFTLAQVPYFGRNMGCDFFEKKCLINEQSINSTMWCVNDTKWGCDFFGLSKGGCSLNTYNESLPTAMQYFASSSFLGGNDKYFDYCPFNLPLVNGKCRGGGGVATKIFINTYEVVGHNSRCFESTLMKKPYLIGSGTYAACYEVLDCNATIITVKVANETIYCSYDGKNFTLSGWNGWFKCPSDRRLCVDSPCKSYCFARGSCSGRSVCSCFPGYGGDYCEVTCYPNCKNCSNKDNCLSCISGYSLNAGRCCPQNCESCNISSYCLNCSAGFTESEGKCLINSQCIRWIQQSDLSLTLRSNFFELEVSFNASLSISIENVTFALDSSSLPILGESFKELKLNSSLFLIQLGKNNKVFSQNLTFNFSLLFAEMVECGFLPQGLVTTITSHPFGHPSPVAIIKAPSKFGTNCQLIKSFYVSAELSTGGLGNDLTCFWSFSPTLDLSASVLNSCTVQIDSSLVDSISELNVGLTVKNYIGNFGSASKSIKIENSADLYVDLSENSSCSTSEKCVISIDSISQCNVSQSLGYEWTLTNNTAKGLRMLQTNSDLPSLTIDSQTLTPGLWIFQLSVSKDGASLENLRVQLDIPSQAPRINLDKSPGHVSTLVDFTLDALQSIDLNLQQSDSGLICEWKCFNQLKSCDFLIESTGCKLKIDQKYLRSDRITHLAVKVTSKEYKTSTEKVFEMFFIDSEVPLVRIFESESETSVKKLPLFESTRIKALVNSSRIEKVQWSIDSQLLSSDYFVDLTPSKLNLNPGTVFKLKFDLTVNDSEIYSFFEEFLINSPPSFGSLHVSPDSGNESSTQFLFSASGWLDDEEDFPLQYFFSYETKSNHIPLKSSQSNFLLTTLSYIGNPARASCRVSDSLGDYTIVRTEIKIQKNQNLNLKKYIKQNEIIEPATNIPLVIGNLLAYVFQKDLTITNQSLADSETLEIYQEIYEYCQLKIAEFVEISEPSESFLDIVLEHLLKLTSSHMLKTKFNFNSSHPIISAILEKMSDIGLAKNKVLIFLQVMENISKIDDQVVMKLTDNLTEILGVIDSIYLLVLARIKEGIETQFSTQMTYTRFSVEENRNFKGFSFKNSEFSVDLPAEALNFTESEDFSIGFVTSHFKGQPILNSSHDFISFSAFNVTGSKKLSVNLNDKLIFINIPVNLSELADKNSKCCYLNSTLGWDDHGCQVISINNDSVLCGCSHLSTFAFIPETTSIKDVSKSHGIKEFTIKAFRLPGFLLCLCLFLIYCLVILRIRLMKHRVDNLETSEANKTQFKLEESKDQHHETDVNSDQRLNFSIGVEKKKPDPRVADEDDLRRNNELVKELAEKQSQNEQELVKQSPAENQRNYKSKYSSNMFLDQFHSFHILVALKLYRYHIFHLTRVFFVFYLLLLLDSVYYDYRYRSKSAREFEDFLRNNLILFNFITILFSASVGICVKILLSILMYLIRGKIRIFLVLHALIFLVSLFLVFMISYYSEGFDDYINKVWVVCAFLSINIELFLVDPLMQLLGIIIRYIFIRLKRQRKTIAET